MKVISFEAKKKQKADRERYEYIKSMCQFQQPDLFDQLISEQVLSDEKIASCSRFIIELKERGVNALDVLEEAVFIYDDEFYEDWNINWYRAIEKALVYYAVKRQHDKDAYDIALQLHPFVGSF